LADFDLAHVPFRLAVFCDRNRKDPILEFCVDPVRAAGGSWIKRSNAP